MKKSWITSARTFSNNDYWDPKHMRFSDLEVINDDTVEPGGVVALHEHSNMEIFGYVVVGPCDHTDNLGNRYSAASGTVQRMSAGSGIQHTEGNSSDHAIRYLQLWIKPGVFNTQPEYAHAHFSREQKLNRFVDITQTIAVKQDSRLLAGIFTQAFVYPIDPKRQYYLYTVTGPNTGDGYAYTNESVITIDPSSETELILFDLR